jgi:small redox-active disulfide protein 2
MARSKKNANAAKTAVDNIKEEKYIMGLFNKKKTVQTPCDCKDCDCSKPKEENNSENASIKILGSGCAKCNQLEKATKEAMEQLGINEPIDHVTDFTQIASYGVMSTPALVVDGKVVSYGKVLNTSQVVELLQKVR